MTTEEQIAQCQANILDHAIKRSSAEERVRWYGQAIAREAERLAELRILAGGGEAGHR